MLSVITSNVLQRYCNSFEVFLYRYIAAAPPYHVKIWIRQRLTWALKCAYCNEEEYEVLRLVTTCRYFLLALQIMVETTTGAATICYGLLQEAAAAALRKSYLTNVPCYSLSFTFDCWKQEETGTRNVAGVSCGVLRDRRLRGRTSRTLRVTVHLVVNGCLDRKSTTGFDASGHYLFQGIPEWSTPFSCWTQAPLHNSFALLSFRPKLYPWRSGKIQLNRNESNKIFRKFKEYLTRNNGKDA